MCREAFASCYVRARIGVMAMARELAIDLPSLHIYSICTVDYTLIRGSVCGACYTTSTSTSTYDKYT